MCKDISNFGLRFFDHKLRDIFADVLDADWCSKTFSFHLVSNQWSINSIFLKYISNYGQELLLMKWALIKNRDARENLRKWLQLSYKGWQ